MIYELAIGNLNKINLYQNLDNLKLAISIPIPIPIPRHISHILSQHWPYVVSEVYVVGNTNKSPTYCSPGTFSEISRIFFRFSTIINRLRSRRVDLHEAGTTIVIMRIIHRVRMASELQLTSVAYCSAFGTRYTIMYRTVNGKGRVDCCPAKYDIKTVILHWP